MSKIEGAFDDVLSVAAKEVASSYYGAGDVNLPASAIPFTADELRAMLAVVEKAEPAAQN